MMVIVPSITLTKAKEKIACTHDMSVDPTLACVLYKQTKMLQDFIL